MSKSSCNLLSWNVRSILGKDKRENFLQILDDRNIDIACVCETWFDSQSTLGTLLAMSEMKSHLRRNYAQYFARTNDL